LNEVVTAYLRQYPIIRENLILSIQYRGRDLNRVPLHKTAPFELHERWSITVWSDSVCIGHGWQPCFGGHFKTCL